MLKPNVTTSITIEGADAIEKAFREMPAEAEKNFGNALKASIMEIEKRAVDSNFKFKTPRSLRTGFLQQSFAFGLSIGGQKVTKSDLFTRRVTLDGLYGSVGPTIEYAPKVHRDNPFMDRIKNAANPSIQKHFRDALMLTTNSMNR